MTGKDDDADLGRMALPVTAVTLSTVLVATLYEASRGTAPEAVAAIAGFYLATTAAFAAFAVWTAGDLGLPSLLSFGPLPPKARLRRLAIYGLGMGLVLSVALVWIAGPAGTALRPWFWARIQTPTARGLFAANAALVEETFFRLFLIPLIVSLILRGRPHRFQLRLSDGSAKAVHHRPRTRPWMVFIAVVVSSVLFGLAHRYTNPLPAMFLGPLLAVSYLRGGWESAVIAHFLANFLVFSLVL